MPSGTDRRGPGLSGAIALSFRDIAEHVFHSLSLGVIVFDPELRVVLRNQAAESMLPAGDSIAEILDSAAVESRYENWAKQLRQVIETSQQRTFDGVTCKVAEGETRLLNLRCAALTDVTTGQAIGGLLIVEDATVRITMERRLAVSERLAAVGKLAARVAHELNNPLDGIMRYINLAIRVTESGGPSEQAIRYLNEAYKGLSRMVKIIGDLLEFSRTSYAVFEEANVNRFVEDAIKALQDKAGMARVAIVSVLDEGMPVLRAGSNLFQVFCNLIKNAIDAMPDGGTLTITTKKADRDVLVIFEDTGAGLPEDVEQIFQPFFTTKPPGQGTGLGLAICKDIVEKYNGKIYAENRPEGGARFTVVIPADSLAAPGKSP